jgi:ubiquinol-cytochrome c reductase cytochrome b subunit
VSFGDWLNERTGHRELLRHALDEPVQGGARFAYVWGSAITLSLVVQAVTGWLLMSAYAPSATTAWSSVAHITFTMRAGWIIRGLHHFGAQAMIVLLALHIGQTALFGAYRRPRELNWLFGLGLLGVTLGFALTGYLLPWDQKGYWATRVATNIAGTIPVVGLAMQRLLVGGAEYGHLTLTRFYSLHVFLLPVLTALLLVAHIALFRKHGVTPPRGANLRIVDRFYPKQVGMDLLVAFTVLVVVFLFTSLEHGAPLDAPADPASDYPARPEWYFLPLFELLKYFHGALEPVGAVGIPAVLGLYLVLLPFIDKKADSGLAARLPVLAPLVLIALGSGGLIVKSLVADATDGKFVAARAVASQRAARAAALFKEGVPPEGPLAMLRDDPETRGEELFGKQCASCHKLGEIGPPKEKQTAPDLTGFGTKAWVLAVLDDPDADHLFGKTPFRETMPSMTKPPADPEAAKVFTPMSAADQGAIAEFLEAQARGEQGAAMPGEALVKRRCTSCHRLDGKTDDDDSAAPELRGWASLAWIEAQITNPGSGKAYPKAAMAKDLAGHMPAFEEKLPERDRKILASWVHRHSRAEADRAGAPANAPAAKP